MTLLRLDVWPGDEQAAYLMVASPPPSVTGSHKTTNNDNLHPEINNYRGLPCNHSLMTCCPADAFEVHHEARPRVSAAVDLLDFIGKLSLNYSCRLNQRLCIKLNVSNQLCSTRIKSQKSKISWTMPNTTQAAFYKGGEKGRYIWQMGKPTPHKLSQ